MRRIYKYQVFENLPFELDLPAGSRVVHVGLQQDNPQMWVEGDNEQPQEKHTFMIFGTGWDIPPQWQYISTYLSPGQNFVWHLYEKVPQGALYDETGNVV